MPTSPAPTDVMRTFRAELTPPPKPTAPGFDVLEEIGRGGMGLVYRAKQTALNRIVALKVVLAGEYADEGDQLRFVAEAEAAAAVKHPNIVEVYQFGFHRGAAYFAMEFLPGGTLARQLADRGPLPPDEAARIVEAVARGIQAAHEVGVVHRDIKPANILFDTDTPKIADFGLAKRGAGYDLTLTGMVVGTPAYMAPEQATGRSKTVGPPADIYSIGAILYECLTGRPPFISDDPHEVLLHLVSDDPASLRSVKSDVPRDLELICLKCLAKSPSERYTAAGALADDLARFRNREPVSVRPPGRLEKGVKWVRRYPSRAAIYVLGSLAVLLLALAVGAASLLEDAENAKSNLGETLADLREETARTEAARKDTQAATRLAESRLVDAVRAKQEAELAKSQESATNERLAEGSAHHAIGLANREFEVNNVPAMRTALDSCRADFRTWEWKFLDRSIRRELRIVPAQSDVGFLTVAADGQLIACGSVSAARWDTEKWSWSWLAKTIGTRSSAANLAGTRLAVFTEPYKLAIFELPSGREVSSIRTTGADVAISADASLVGIADHDDRARIFDTTTGEKRVELAFDGVVRCLAFDPKVKRIAVGGTEKVNDVYVGLVRFWDPSGRKVLWSFAGHGKQVVKLAFSPDGSRIAGLAKEGGIQVWETTTGRKPALIPTAVVDSAPFPFAFSPDGRRIVTGGPDRVVRVWDASNGVELFTFRGHELPVLAVAFSTDGTKLYCGGEDRTIRVWNVAVPPDAIRLLGAKGMTDSIAVTNDGQRLLTCSGAGVPQIFDGTTGTVRWSSPDWAGALQLKPDGREFRGWAAGEFREWSLPTGEVLTRKPNALPKVIAVSADGERVATGGRFGTMLILNAATGKLVKELNSGKPHLNWAALSPDGSRVVTAGGMEIAAKVWDVSSGKVIRELHGHNGSIQSVAFSPDGTRIATGGRDGWLKVWDAATGRNVLTICRGTDAIYAVGYSPDGSRLLTCDWKGIVTTYDAGR